MKSKHLLWLVVLFLTVSFTNVTFAQENEMQKPPHEKQEFNKPHAGAEGAQFGDRQEGKEGCHQKPPVPMIPGLTKDQEASLKKIHLKSEKDILPIENQIGELEAKLRTLTTEDTPDVPQIDQLIDQISGLRAKIEKIHMKLRLDTRKLLTEEQRLGFDKHSEKLPPPPPQNQ